MTDAPAPQEADGAAELEEEPTPAPHFTLEVQDATVPMGGGL